jgi:hypothetical protein
MIVINTSFINKRKLNNLLLWLHEFGDFIMTKNILKKFFVT